MTKNEEKLIEALKQAIDGIDHAALWIEDYALPHLPEDCDGGNSLHAGLEHLSEELGDVIKEVEATVFRISRDDAVAVLNYCGYNRAKHQTADQMIRRLKIIKDIRPGKRDFLGSSPDSRIESLMDRIAKHTAFEIV